MAVTVPRILAAGLDKAAGVAEPRTKLNELYLTAEIWNE